MSGFRFNWTTIAGPDGTPSEWQRVFYAEGVLLFFSDPPEIQNNYLASQTDLVEDSVKDVEKIFDYYIQNLNKYKCCFTCACFVCDSAFNIGKYSVHNWQWTKT